MSETKAEFRIDKPGAYKLSGGGIADIVEVNHKSAFGWLRSDICPMSIRRWDRTGIADAGCWDIIEAIPFVVDGPGRYMMRNGRVATVWIIAPVDEASQPVRGMDGSAKRTWHSDGRWSSDHHPSSYDLVRKMHPLEQEPVAKAPEAPKAPETKDPLAKPAFRITEHGVYCTRNGRVVDVYEVTDTKAYGHWTVSGNKREWDLNGRTHSYIELGSDIVMKAPPADGVLTITDVLNRLKTDWYRQLTERKEKARKNNRSTKTPETPKTPPTLHDVMQGIEGKPTQKPSEEQLKLAYQVPEQAAQPEKKPAFRITGPGEYRTRDGWLVNIHHVSSEIAIGTFPDHRRQHVWHLDGRSNEHVESPTDIVGWPNREKTATEIAMEQSEAALKRKSTEYESDESAPEAKSPEPKKPSAGFDVVIIKLGDSKCILVVGYYENKDHEVTVRSVDVDPAYVQRKCQDAIILQEGSYVMCPDVNVTCVIHYGGEE